MKGTGDSPLVFLRRSTGESSVSDSNALAETGKLQAKAVVVFPFQFHVVSFFNRQCSVMDQEHHQGFSGKYGYVKSEVCDLLDRLFVVDGERQLPMHGDRDRGAFTNS